MYSQYAQYETCTMLCKVFEMPRTKAIHATAQTAWTLSLMSIHCPLVMDLCYEQCNSQKNHWKDIYVANGDTFHQFVNSWLPGADTWHHKLWSSLLSQQQAITWTIELGLFQVHVRLEWSNYHDIAYNTAVTETDRQLEFEHKKYPISCPYGWELWDVFCEDFG